MLTLPTLWPTALSNRKLTPAIYRAMRGKRINNPLFAIPQHLNNQVIFKKAYHNPKTTPEIRAILLNIAFGSRADLFNTLSMYESEKFGGREIDTVAVTVKEDESGYYLDLVQYGRQAKLQPRTTLALQKLIQPSSPHNTIITALQTEDKRGLYIAQWKNELFVGLYTLGDFLRILVKTNDIWNVIYNYDDEPEDNVMDREPTLDYEQAIQDLNHIKSQLIKFEHMANKVGVSFNTLFRLVDEFKDEMMCLWKIQDYSNITDEVADQYRLFMRIPDIEEEINNVIPSIKNVNKDLFPTRFPIPKFIDYNPQKSIFRREKVNLTNFQDELRWIEQHFTNKLKDL